MPVSWLRSQRIIPAYAGSTTLLGHGRNYWEDHPRIRGEHISALISRLDRLGSSPHTRGAPDQDARRTCTQGIIPAYAGSTNICESGRIMHEGSSPHTRGAPLERTPARRRRRIIPAYAGSTRPGRRGDGRAEDHPRIRGEHLTRYLPKEADIGSSPHTRGAPQIRLARALEERIIPAYAGSTLTQARQAKSMRDHPRIRGEHIRRQNYPHHTPGSSPHTRGAPVGNRPHYRHQPDHPRIRGEHIRTAAGWLGSAGSSPHTRGALEDRLGGHQVGRIIPAYAGSTIPSRRRRGRRADHPRIRGEHLVLVPSSTQRVGSSPHTRGALAED